MVSGFDLNQEEIVKFKLWPNGIIPYYIDIVSFPDKDLRNIIRKFLDGVNGMSELRFTELTAPPSDTGRNRWVIFMNRRGLQDCQQHTTAELTMEGVQAVFLGYECLAAGGDLPEAVLAIAGVPPQHNAPNRDDYITIIQENIIPNKTQLFGKLGDQDWLFHDLKYDFQSAGHFHSHKYSGNGRATIQAKNPNSTIVENTKLSQQDILKLNMLYNYIVTNISNNTVQCEAQYKPNPNYAKTELYLYKQGACVAMKRRRRKPLKKPRLYTGEKELKKHKNNNPLDIEAGQQNLKKENMTDDQAQTTKYKGKSNVDQTTIQAKPDNQENGKKQERKKKIATMTIMHKYITDTTTK